MSVTDHVQTQVTPCMTPIRGGSKKNSMVYPNARVDTEGDNKYTTFFNLTKIVEDYPN